MSFDEGALIEYVTSRRWYGAKSRSVSHADDESAPATGATVFAYWR